MPNHVTIILMHKPLCCGNISYTATSLCDTLYCYCALLLNIYGCVICTVVCVCACAYIRVCVYVFVCFCVDMRVYFVCMRTWTLKCMDVCVLRCNPAFNILTVRENTEYTAFCFHSLPTDRFINKIEQHD